MNKETAEILKLFIDETQKRKDIFSYKEIAKIAKNMFGRKFSDSMIRDRIRRNLYKFNIDSMEEFKKKVLNKEILSSDIDQFYTAVDKELYTQNLPSNWSTAWRKTDGWSIMLRNKKESVTYEDMRDQLLKEMREYAPKYPVLKRNINESEDLMFTIDPADVHFGKLASKGETGEAYSLDIAKERFEEGIDGLLELSKGFKFQKILFVLGNDILHIDNPKRTTTSGTPQDTDGMWQDSFQLAKQCYIKAIEKCLLIADVHLVFCPSNHDFMSGYMLADSVSSWFANNKNVTSQISMQHRQYVKFGDNLIGLTHGDGAKLKDLGLLMAKEAKKAWGETTFRYWIEHHVHHKWRITFDMKTKAQTDIEKDRIGYTEIKTGLKQNPENLVHVEYIRSPSAPDRWHATNGYVNMQAIEAFMYHPTRGQIGRFTHYF